MGDLKAEVVVIGSGAGGATVAATLSKAGYDVLILEEGPSTAGQTYETHSPTAMRSIYRDGGTSVISAQNRIPYVEGKCVGGSTEINSGFWHRLPPSVLASWQVDYGLNVNDNDKLTGLFEELESELGLVTIGNHTLPPSSAVFKKGLDKLGWDARETPRLQRGDPTASQFRLNAKSTMSLTMIPKALSSGARLLSNCKVSKLITNGNAVTGIQASVVDNNTSEEIVVNAKYVWVCGGTIQTPLLLLRSGIRHNIGGNLQIHPMIKVVAEFDQRLDAHDSVMPVFQIRDHASDVFIGGSVFTPGFLAMALADSGNVDSDVLVNWRNCAIFYVSTKSRGFGSVDTLPFSNAPRVKFRLAKGDASNLSAGLLRLSEVLFQGGALRLFPGIENSGIWDSVENTRGELSSSANYSRMRLSTVHLTSTCPIGENTNRCAANSRGRINGVNNVYVADASALPSAPGVNPQGTVMTVAFLNARKFATQTNSL